MRLLIHVEGETEETFVNELIRPHLIPKGFERVDARIIGNARLRARRGGIRSWQSVRLDIVNHLRQDDGAIATTMVDYYALPSDGDDAWPGRSQASRSTFANKATVVETAIEQDLTNQMGQSFNRRRFVPFVIMHEFEGLLFSDCHALCRTLQIPNLLTNFQTIRNSFSTPEEINDSPITAPSKRIKALISHYEKPLYGNIAALEIGLEKIREQCPHFNSWVARLESLALGR